MEDGVDLGDDYVIKKATRRGVACSLPWRAKVGRLAHRSDARSAHTDIYVAGNEVAAAGPQDPSLSPRSPRLG